MVVINSPYNTAMVPSTLPSAFATPSFTIHLRSLKLALNNKPINGDTIPAVNEVTTLLKAAPITKPTAISSKLPFKANSLNSFNIINKFWISEIQIY